MAKEQIKEEVVKLLSKSLCRMSIFDVVPFVEHPANEGLGDYSTNVALILSKTLNRPALNIANDIAKNIPNSKKIEKVDVVKPGFINFWVSKAAFVDELENILACKDLYGSSDWGKGKVWLIEHTSANPNKALHLGHLRNNVTGMAISNLWEFSGINVVRDYVDNDRGIAIAKLMWGYLKYGRIDGKEILNVDYWFEHQDEWKGKKDLDSRPDRFVDSLYAKVSKDFENKDAEKVIRDFVVRWEAEDEKIWALWEKVLKFSYKGQKDTLERLGSKVDKVWHEHNHYKMGKGLVEEGLRKGVFVKLPDGAVLSDLKKYGLPDTILIKSDGTSLYITQDLALTKLKKETFHPDRMFWVIGPEQSLAMKQLFAICDQLGIGKLSDFVHITFGYMSVKGTGKMSSRFGNVVYIDDLIDEAKKVILKKNPSDNVAEVMALGAVKYSILHVGRTTDTVFDFKSSLSFEGDSGPYLQYTYARCRNVLKDFKDVNLMKVPGSESINAEELAILRHIYKFPEIVEKSAKEYSPNLVCAFLFELARRYSIFYDKHRIADAADGNIRAFRLTLSRAVSQVLKNGLGLLGIGVLEKV